MVASLEGSASFGSRDGEGMKAGVEERVRNVACAYAWWVARGCLGIGILKAVPFDTLKVPGRAFFDTFFAQFLIGTHTTSPLHSYQTLSSLPFGRERLKIETHLLKGVGMP